MGCSYVIVKEVWADSRPPRAFANGGLCPPLQPNGDGNRQVHQNTSWNWVCAPAEQQNQCQQWSMPVPFQRVQYSIDTYGTPFQSLFVLKVQL